MDGRSRVTVMLAGVVCAGLLVAAVGWGAAPPPGVGTAPGSAPLWTAATGPITGSSNVSVVGDVSGDGVSDLLVAEHGLRGPSDVALIDGGSGGEIWRRRFDDRPTAPAVWIVLGRGPSVLVAHGGALSVIDARTGEVVREVTLRAPIGEISAARLDTDDVPDVVYSAGSDRDDLLVALSGVDLSEMWTVTAGPDDSRFGNGFTRLTVLDLDRDGRDEVLVCENMRSVLVLSREGEVVWETEPLERTQYVPVGAVSGPPVLGDFLGGGLDQLAIGLWAGTLVVVDPADGEVLAQRLFGVDTDERRKLARSRRLPGFLRAILTEAGEPINELLPLELDGASGREVVFGCSDGFVYAYSPRADRILWRHDSSGQVFRRPVAVDADDDGAPDVLAWDEEGVYLIDGRTGDALEGFPLGTDLSNAVFADLDGDGAVELIELRRDGSMHAFATGLQCVRVPGAAGCAE